MKLKVCLPLQVDSQHRNRSLYEACLEHAKPCLEGWVQHRCLQAPGRSCRLALFMHPNLNSYPRCMTLHVAGRQHICPQQGLLRRIHDLEGFSCWLQTQNILDQPPGVMQYVNRI
jgi:hypothetical protein